MLDTTDLKPRKRLQVWRYIDQEISTTDLGELLGVSRQSVWNIEQGVNLPGLELAARIERLTGIPANEWRKES